VRPASFIVSAWAALLLGAGEAAARPAVPESAVREALARAWEEHGPAGSEITIRVLPKLLADEGNAWTLEVEMPHEPGRPGPRVLPVSCVAQGRPVSRGLASVIVRAEQRVAIAACAVTKGREAGPEVFVITTKTFDAPTRALFTPEDGARYRAARDLVEGELLHAADLRRIPDVSSGDPVTLVADAGTTRVGVPGTVRRSGMIGDTILVTNPVTRAVVRAVLLDRRTARLVPTPAVFTSRRPR
jgi:flagella basal body P-ring formation protein FlgA